MKEPKEFTLSGEVGWEIDEWNVKNILRAGGGEDIKINFTSPGGSVFTGITMFNLFKNYSGKVHFHLIGLAASMGSYIPLAGDTITAEPNAVYMIHNASTGRYGNHNDLRKTADIIEGLSHMLAKEYVKKTGIPEAEVHTMMDDETFLFGSEIKDRGFVDSIEGEPDADPDARMVHTATAKEAFEATMTKLRDEKPDDYEKAAAIMPSMIVEIKPAAAKVSPKVQEKEKMDMEKLKAEHPAVYAKIIALGTEIGVAAERDRASAHLVMGDASGDMKTAITAVKDGTEMTAALTATYMAAGMNKNSVAAKELDDEETNAALTDVVVDTDGDTDEEKVMKHLEKLHGVDDK